ncbi:MAG: ribonuclease, partial [Pseudomonadota bacterium]|nr:ribonuclease [Pseudomonadota bacterium]
MAEWLYEEGIGENRAALADRGEIVEAQVELPGEIIAGSI